MGCWESNPSVGTLKLPRIPCPSPLWALGVGVRGRSQGVIDKAAGRQKALGGFYFGPEGEKPPSWTQVRPEALQHPDMVLSFLFLGFGLRLVSF